MGNRYLDTKKDSLESSILGVWQEAAVKQEKLVGGQKKLDKDKDGDIDGKDFALLRKSAKKDKKEGAMKRGKDLDTFKPKPKKEEVELDEKVKEYKGVAYFKDRKDAEAHMKKFAPKGRVREYERGYAVQTRIAGPYLNKAGKVEEQVELEKHREFKVQSMRDAMEQVWARSVEDKLFEDINLMSEEQYDEFLDSLNEEELDEIIGRFTAAGQRARAERKLQKTQQKVDDRAAARAAKEKTRELKAAEKQRRRENPGAVRKTAKAVGGAAKKVGSGIASLAKKAKDALMR